MLYSINRSNVACGVPQIFYKKWRVMCKYKTDIEELNVYSMPSEKEHVQSIFIFFLFLLELHT